MGHQKVIENCDKVLSFHPHPDIVLNKNSKLQYLSSKNERKLLIPNILFARFDKPFSQLSAIEFLDAIYDTLNPNIIKVGHDFCFGNKRKGNNTVLKQWAEKKHIQVEETSDINDPRLGSIRSTDIRRLLKSDPNLAIQLLGHPYLIEGLVTR